MLSRLPFVVSSPSDVPVSPSPALAGLVVWLQSFGPSCCSCVLSSRGVSGAAFCRFGLLSHHLLLLFLAWVSSFGVCSDLGWKAAVLSWFLPSFGGGSPSLVLVVFAWRFHLFGCPSSLSFFELFARVLSSRLQCLLITRGGCWIVLGYPPSVAWQREVLPWFSVRGLSACHSGAAVPLGSSVLRSSWSSRWGHLSQVGPVFFLSPRLKRRLSLLLVGLVPGLPAGSPTSGWRCVLRPELVPEAVPPSTRFGPAPSCVWGLQPLASPVYSCGMWSPFGSKVSFCHS